MLIKIIAQRDFEIFLNFTHSKLYGCETLYPIDLQGALIKTFIERDLHNFCFQINNICLYPKYTFDDKEIYEMTNNKYIVLSDEMYDKCFYNCDTQEYNLNIIYDLPKVDMIKLKRINGDFPQNNTIDILLTEYLEKSMVVNLGQEFTLHFDCNDEINNLNYITFEVNNIIYLEDIKKDIHQRLEEMNLTIEFNKNINDLVEFVGFDKCENYVYNFSWLHLTDISKDKKNNIGYIANSEVKIDFIVTENQKELSSVINIPPISIVTKDICDISKNECDKNNDIITVLTKEELRQKRLDMFNKK